MKILGASVLIAESMTMGFAILLAMKAVSYTHLTLPTSDLV